MELGAKLKISFQHREKQRKAEKSREIKKEGKEGKWEA